MAFSVNKYRRTFTLKTTAGDVCCLSHRVGCSVTIRTAFVNLQSACVVAH
jgi:hypothetical protein